MAKQPLLLPKHSTGGRFPVPSLSLHQWGIQLSDLASSMSPGKKRGTAPTLSTSTGQHEDSLRCRCGPCPPVCTQITLNFYHSTLAGRDGTARHRQGCAPAIPYLFPIQHQSLYFACEREVSMLRDTSSCLGALLPQG